MGNAPGGLGLAPYVPRLALEWDLDATGARWRAMEATCCFVDISGFTALSERLARRGRIGAEELTEVLNHVFSRMLEVAYAKGGALLKFGGDALLLAFAGDDHATMAAQGAVAMRAALREARTLPTSVGRLNLKMSVGIHSGLFHLVRVGGAHHELLITGPAATATTRMEQTADAGEIVISPQTAHRLPAGAVGDAKGEGRLLRWRHVVHGGPGPLPPRPVSPAAVAACVPVALRARLGQRGGESEHRLASVAFVKFQGVDDLLDSDGPDRTAAALDTVVRTIQDAADSESVTFLGSDIDANGGKVILITGVPVTLEDDEGRLLRVVRRVADAPLPLPVRIGVNRGHVFAGDIGTAYRRTFTVMGDTVNLAARLMAAARPGELLATASVLARARTQFDTEAREPFRVKGKAEPVQAFGVGPAAGSRSDSFGFLPFRGRDKELATLLDALSAATAGRGRTVLVDAERGIGKTRLVTEFATFAPAGQVLWLQGEPHRVGVPYHPLRPALRALLGLDARDREDAGRQLLAALTALGGGLLPFAPLLAAVVEADVPPTPEAEAVAEEFVRSRIADLVVTTLDAACPAPLLIVAEDAHWFDDTTSDICGRLSAAATSRPWLVSVTRRPEAAGGFAPPDPETRLPLALLSDDVARELVEVATETAPLRPHERDAVVTRAGGNPLFLEELLHIVGATEVEALPESLDAVAMREIDALATIPRRVLRLASVLGRSFDRRLLVQLLAAEGVDTGADPLADLRTQLVPEGVGEQLRFRHAVLQEAAYQSLPFRQRLDLHRKAGEALERDTADPDAVAPLLSLHFLSAQDWARTWRYARVAARVAQQAHAHGEVVVHLDRAVAACRRLGTVTDEECAPVFSELGHALELLGEYERADAAYRGAVAATRDPLQRGQIACRRAYLRTEFLGRPSAAVRQLRAARKELDALGGRAAGLRALLLAEEADARLRQGRLDESMRCAAQAAGEAERAGEKGALALSLHARSVCLVRMGRADEAHEMARVLHLYSELGDDVKVAGTLGNIATVAFFASQWDEAAHYVGLSIEASTKVGDLAGAALAQGNLGELRTNQGRLDEAVAILAPARRTLESFGYPVMSAGTAMQLGRARAFLGDLEGGLDMMRAALSTFGGIGSHFESLEARARLAEVLAFGGRFPEARDELARARALEREVGETPFTAVIERVRLALAASSGDERAVLSGLDDFFDLARRVGATYEELVVLALMERLGHRTRVEDAARLTKDLGVVRLPMFPA